MRRTRQVIAVMVVATALCAAERTQAALPAVVARPQSHGLARTLAQKLTSSFRQTVSVVRVVGVRAEECAPSFALPIREAASGVRSDFSPFQFRLPPPTV